MRLGLSLGVNAIGGNSDVVINAMGGGQSLIVQMDDAAFVSSAGSGSTFVDAAVNGSAITKTVGDQTTATYWVNDSGALADGTNLIAYLAAVDANHASRTDVNVVVWQQWNQSRSLVTATGAGTGEITPAEYATSFEYLVTRWKAEHGSDVSIIIGLPHRRTSGNDQENYGCQQMRQKYIEIAEADSNIYLVESCDIDLTDATHMTVAGRTEFGTRMGLMANHAVSSGILPDYPVLQSATIDYGVVTLNLNSDITAPSSGVGQVAGESGGLLATGSTLTRSGANTALFTLADNNGIRIDNSPAMRISSGVNAGLATTNADTLNNSAGTLPARGAYVAMTDGNTITSISDVKEFWDAKYSKKTFGVGLLVDSIEGLKGSGFATHPSSTSPTYEAGAFANGRGGLKATVDTVCMQNIDTFVAGAVHTLFYSIVVPASPSSNIRIHQFGLHNGASDTDTSCYGNGANVSYYRNQAGSFTNLTTTGAEHIICFRFNSLSSCDVFVDSTSVSVNFDPRDDYSAGTYNALHLFSTGGASDGLINGIFGAFGYSDSALTNTEVSSIMTELGTEFGVTIS